MRIAPIITLALSIMVLTACSDNGSNSNNPLQASGGQPLSFSATLTDMQITRSADQKDLPVNNLPAQGAQITVE